MERLPREAVELPALEGFRGAGMWRWAMWFRGYGGGGGLVWTV